MAHPGPPGARGLRRTGHGRQASCLSQDQSASADESGHGCRSTLARPPESAKTEMIRRDEHLPKKSSESKRNARFDPASVQASLGCAGRIAGWSERKRSARQQDHTRGGQRRNANRRKKGKKQQNRHTSRNWQRFRAAGRRRLKTLWRGLGWSRGPRPSPLRTGPDQSCPVLAGPLGAFKSWPCPRRRRSLGG